MSVSDTAATQPTNGLNRVATVTGVLVSTLLLAGAYGHFVAVWPSVTGDGPRSARLLLMLPGGVLLVAGFANALVSKYLWDGARWALTVALLCNVLAAAYFTVLLGRGVPDHPIGLFVAVVGAHTVILSAIRVGLRWPS